MTRLAFVVCFALAGVLACNRSPSAPTGPDFTAAGRVGMTFTAQDHSFSTAAETYRGIWADEGAAIVDAMERQSGLSFREAHVRAIVFEGMSVSGSGASPMYLRASYPNDVKKATLVHEHGHRLIAQLTSRPADLDEHRVLFLFLYDTWVRLWGQDLADAQVRFESGLTGRYDYAGAWRSALSLSRDQRAARFADIVRANQSR